MMMFRSLMRSQRWLPALIVALALCVRAFLPAGYMVGQDGSASRTVSIQICSSSGIKALSLTLRPTVLAVGQHSSGNDAVKSSGDVCAFSSLLMQGLEGISVLLLTAPLSFTLLLTIGRVWPSVISPHKWVRPPLRAPPVRQHSLLG